ncbi:hypothetical protein CSV80_17115 [Sporosarcina sp. P12(2017)]|nr:hypothetical protein CSV81_17075 [Sporosarcina sp. P10]PIC59244.1 hypothetical protein CSV80_17115 [Sporosarcina sp. P12(2017)]
MTLRPPYRQPHHSASAISLIGGGTKNRYLCIIQFRH